MDSDTISQLKKLVELALVSTYNESDRSEMAVLADIRNTLKEAKSLLRTLKG